MSELMPCQLCGGRASFCDDSQGPVDEFVRAGCWVCGCRGPIVEFDEYFDDCDEQQEKHNPEAARRWNEMQTLIARGKLLDEPSSPSMKARL